MKLKHYKNEFRDAIIAFNKKSFPLRKGVEKSFEDRFIKNPYLADFSKSTFLITEENEILGQFLVMSTQFHYQKKTFDGFWGMDFIIDNKLRGQKKGKILAEKTISVANYCVMGLSDASENIHIKYGNKELAKAFRYVRLTGVGSIFNFLFYNKNFKREDVIYPETIEYKKAKVKRVYNINEIPERAFWNAETLEWDRSHRFLEWRFFNYNNKYAFYYAEDFSFYFVIRKIRWKNMNCILLVDYRYQSKNDFEIIYKMVLKASAKVKSIAVITLSSMDNEKLFLKKNYNKTFAEPIPIMTTNTDVIIAKKVLATAADSDFDTFYGDNVW